MHSMIRRTVGSPSTLNHVFKSSSAAQFRNVLEWSYPRYRSQVFFCGLAPKYSSHLAKWLLFPFDSPSDALGWVSALGDFKHDEIKRYNQFVVSVEGLGKNYDKI